MEKLELKHLTPYLPYGLNFKAESEIWQLTTVYSLDEYQVWAHNYWCEKKLTHYPAINRKEIFQGKGFKLNEVKLILRPLSDLTKEINGISFIDTWEIGEDNNGTEYDYGNIKLIKQLKHIAQSKTGHWDTIYLPYQVVQDMLENHFDIFGLIEKGLAIDINELNK